MEFLLDDCEATSDTGVNLYDILGDINQENNDFTLTNNIFSSLNEPNSTLEITPESSQHHQPSLALTDEFVFAQQQFDPTDVDFSNINFIQHDSNNSNSSQTDSDSGICSSSSVYYDHSPTSNLSSVNPTIYSSQPPSAINFETDQDLVDQIINSNDIDFSQFDIIGDTQQQVLQQISYQAENIRTENLLNNIEHMIKSMDSQQVTNQKPDASKINIKREPNETDKILINTNNYKKISPKLLPKPSSTKVVQLAPSIPVFVQTVAGSGSKILIENLNSSNSGNIILVDTEAIRSPQAKKSRSENQTQKAPMVESVLNSNPNGSVLNQSLDLDPSLVKKQFRMIKNRESACLSRKRKKEYVTTLEDSLNELKSENDSLKQDNQKLKDKVLVLETENKLLKEQNQKMTSNSVRLIEINRPKVGLSTVKTIPLNSNGSLKRPFIMMAVFFVFGLNILQFINVDTINSSNVSIVSRQLIQQGDNSVDNSPAQLAAAMMISSHNQENSLVDLTVKSRHLLSNYDYPEEELIKKTAQKKLNNDANLTHSVNDSNMELIFINGTWQMIDLNLCYKFLTLNASENQTFFNHTHFNKINNDLNGWFESHVKLLKNSRYYFDDQESFASALWREFIKEKQKKYSPLLARPEKTASFRHLKKNTVKDYPVSLYNTQSRLYENFAKKIRSRKDTFYYVSFRRDHIIFPAISQNKTQRPKVSLILPAYVVTNNETNSETGQKLVHFMQIDCEVTDTRLFSLKSDDLPLDYLKILNQDPMSDFERHKDQQSGYEYH